MALSRHAPAVKALFENLEDGATVENFLECLLGEARRSAAVQENVGPVSPGLVHYTGELLFNGLRPDLAPRDRSLVTISALIANAQGAQIPFHLNRAMDNGSPKPKPPK